MTDRIVESAGECYREIRKRDLQLRKGNGRDDALLKELSTALGCKDGALQKFLDSSILRAEDFLRIFLRITQPFSRMYTEIWNYLSGAVAPTANESISIRFGFRDAANRDEVDLETFRRHIEVLKEVEDLFAVELWPLEAMHKLFELRRIVINSNEKGENRTYPHYRPGRPYELPLLLTGPHAFDRIVLDVHSLFGKIIDEAHRAKSAEEDEERVKGKESEFIQNDWQSYAMRLTDLIPGWNPIFTSLADIPLMQKEEAVGYYTAVIEPLLKKVQSKRMMPVREALDILDLPFWKHRWHTYEIWTGVLTLNCLKDFKPKPRIKNGRIPFDDYATAILADLSTHYFPSANLAIQVQTAYKGSTRQHIKPDLRICAAADLLDPGNTLFVIECKQRKKMLASHIEEVATSYQLGSPNAAGVVILSYDRPPLVLSLPEKVFYLDGFHPNNLAAVTRFKDIIITTLGSIGFTPPLEETAVLLLDISGSMQEWYDNPATLRMLKRVFRIDRLKVFGFHECLTPKDKLITNGRIVTSGPADLASALDQVTKEVGEIDKLLIFTDGDHGSPNLNRWKIKAVHETDNKMFSNLLTWVTGTLFFPELEEE